MVTDLGPEALQLESYLERWRQTVRVATRTGKRLAEAVEAGGKLSFGLKAEEDGPLQVNFEVPDAKTILELAVALRELLNPASDLHHDHLLAILRAQKSAGLDAEVAKFEEAVKRAQRTNVSLNGSDLNGQELFVKLSRSIIFANDTDAAVARAKLDQDPIMRDLLWFTFYNYCITMSKYLIQFMLRLGDRHLFPRGPFRDLVCIYCKSTTAQFSTVDHTLPQSLGNTHSILPRGYACDDCQTLLSVAEQKALKSLPFNMMRVLNIHQTKDGKFTQAKFANVHLIRTGPNSVRMVAQGKTPKKSTPNPEGTSNGQVSMSGKVDAVNVGRVLVKAALGGIALERGRNHVLQPRFDAAREFIQTGKGLK
ncbi:MAG: HNH endonuclease, partial [Halobacteriales archaeon]|nr:HNH endonuclease [Halobacteriales archaeon]